MFKQYNGYKSLAPLSGLLAGVFLMTGCNSEPPPVQQQVRALKTLVVSELATGKQRIYSGTVKASDSSGLSFPVSGTVKDVEVNRGDRVKEGELLAVLDQAPFLLDMEAVQAELTKIESSFEEKALDYQRKAQLVEKGWVSQTSVDQARTARDVASSDIAYATSRLNQARRNLNNTRLYAPFDAEIAERQVNPFTEVKAGERVFELNAVGMLEVEVAVAENTIAQITQGLPVQIRLPAITTTVKGRITEVATVAGAGQLFSVTISMVAPPASLRSGMTAEVSILLAPDAVSAGYLVPLTAIVPEQDMQGGAVFIYDPASSTVRKHKVRVVGARGNLLEISEGIKAGDVIAVAGASFLSDGQTVKLLQPQHF